MTGPNLDLLRDHLANAPRLARLLPGDYLRAAQTPQTTALLRALETVARDELERNGFNLTIVGNPLERVLQPATPMTADFTLLRTALQNGERDARFRPRPTTPAPNAPAIPWGIGMRARLTGDLATVGITEAHRDHLVDIIEPSGRHADWFVDDAQCILQFHVYTANLAPPGATTPAGQHNYRGLETRFTDNVAAMGRVGLRTHTNHRVRIETDRSNTGLNGNDRFHVQDIDCGQTYFCGTAQLVLDPEDDTEPLANNTRVRVLADEDQDGCNHRGEIGTIFDNDAAPPEDEYIYAVIITAPADGDPGPHYYRRIDLERLP